ncbi:MAG: Mur ligase family protein [Bacteroidota bacterium]
MNFKDIKQVYFLGIGGIGMSAIARYFNTLNIPVTGYDKTETQLTKHLASEGINIHYHDRGNELADHGFNPQHTLVVLTPAVPKNHEELTWFRQNEFTILKRSQVLGIITDAYKTIGVAGTHGKTTTSTLLAHILKQSHVDCAAFLGGISTNYNTNLLLHKSAPAPSLQDNLITELIKDQLGNSTHKQLMVVEADEFDRSFLTLHPSIGIITSTDADHLDIYGEHDALKKSFADYGSQVRDVLFIKKELELYNELLSATTKAKVRSYSITQAADAFADNILIKGDTYYFDLHIGDIHIINLHLGIPGLHNVENAVAASAAAIEAGVTPEELRAALASFSGVKRRFEYIIKQENLVYIDDYAHHPTELSAIIGSVKNMYPGKKVLAVFQPHLYSRTRDFVDGFAESLSMADETILLDIYPARELPMEGVTSKIIFDKMKLDKKTLSTKEQLLDLLKTKNVEVLLTVGAGDIDTLVNPIGEMLNAKF